MVKFYASLIFTLFLVSLTAQITVTDSDLTSSSNVTWTNDQVYILDGYVFLEAGGKLTIEPGTVIKGKATPSFIDNASALIITKGAQIFAEGTASSPIIFTSELDDVNNNSELNEGNNGLWGGLIILGNGIVGVDGGKENIEGIPSTEGRAEYGGNDNDDNSGILRYVSIRHAGKALEANNEINGLTLGAVGRGTIIDYIEVYANKDDGIEWFGGAVNVKHAVVSFCGDDSFDFDQSWNGNGQFWFSLQNENGNRAGEWDGSEASDLGPSVVVTVSNATFIGAGSTTTNEDGNDALRIRDAAAAKVYNSLFIDFADRAIRVDDDFDGDSYDRLENGEFAFKNNVFYNIAAGDDYDAITKAGDDKTALLDLLENGDNLVTNPAIGGISRSTDGGLDPRTSSALTNFQAAIAVEGDFFDNVDYIGAFSNNTNWAKGWTALDAYGYFGDLVLTDTKNTQLTDLAVYPNPTTDLLQITFESKERIETVLEVRNILGQLISVNSLTAQAGENRLSIDLSNEINGTYLLTISTKDGLRSTKKLIKN